MSRNQLAKRSSMTGVAAVAGYLALIAIALASSWTALSAIGEQRASVSAAQTMLAQLQGRSLFARKDDGVPLGGAPAGSPFLEGQTLNVAGAALLQRVAAAVRRIGGNVLSSQVDLDNARAKDGWVGLVVSCEIEEASLQRLLYDVEAGMPFLFIDQLVVQAPMTGVDGRRMRILMAVSGQWWSGK
jgi:general secretion pathway protein M